MRYLVLFSFLVLASFNVVSLAQCGQYGFAAPLPSPCDECGASFHWNQSCTDIYINHGSNCSQNPANWGSKPSTSAPNSSAPRPSTPKSSSPDLSTVVTGIILQSMLNSIFASPSPEQTEKEQWEAQQAEMARIAEQVRQQKIRDSIALAKHNQMMGLYKPIEGSTLDNDISFKMLDGEMEELRKGASDQFDSGLTVDGIFSNVSSGTNFFGTMDNTQIDILFDPDNDPMVVDLTEAKLLLVDTAGFSKYSKKIEEQGEPIQEEKMTIEECQKVEKNMQRNIENREKYVATIQTTINELDYWKEKNNAAMMNGFMDGLSYVTGVYIKQQEEKNEPANLLKKAMLEVLKKEPNNKGAANLIAYLDANYLSKNWAQTIISSYSKYESLKGKYKSYESYYGVVKDALKNTLDGMSSLDDELMEMMKDPSIASFLNDDAFMKSCTFVGKEAIINPFLKSKTAQKALESVFKAKIPYVSMAQFAIKEAYNAYEWYLSREAILNLNQVHGKELQTAQLLQDRIFSDQIKLDQLCK